jgi:hypothetical protein
MVQASTVAVAVAVLGAASTLAVPQFGAGDFLEAREVYDDNALEARGFFGLFGGSKKKSASATATAAATPLAAKPVAGAPIVPPLKEAAAVKPAAGGAMPTVTRHLRAKPTQCKAGEKASWDKANHKPIHGSGSSRAAAHPAHNPVAARAVAPTAAAPVAGAPIVKPTPAPAAEGATTGKTPFGQGKVIGTRTTKGANGHKTVVHVLPPRRTRCYAEPTAAASSHGSSASKLEVPEGAAQHALGAHHHAAEAKLVARAVDILAEYLNQLD